MSCCLSFRRASCCFFCFSFVVFVYPERLADEENQSFVLILGATAIFSTRWMASASSLKSSKLLLLGEVAGSYLRCCVVLGRCERPPHFYVQQVHLLIRCLIFLLNVSELSLSGYGSTTILFGGLFLLKPSFHHPAPDIFRPCYRYLIMVFFTICFQNCVCKLVEAHLFYIWVVGQNLINSFLRVIFIDGFLFRFSNLCIFHFSELLYKFFWKHFFIHFITEFVSRFVKPDFP